MDLVPTQCGGSGGTGIFWKLSTLFCIWFVPGGGIDSSLSLLSLFQNPVGGISGGGNIYNSGSSGGSIAIYPGQSGYNSYGAGKP